MGRITNESAVTTLADADVLYKDNPSTGSGKIAVSDFKAQFQAKAEKGVANGYASLDANGLVTAAQLQPSFTIEEVADATARDALTIVSGEVGKRLVRLTSTGVIYLANATGSGSSKWTVFNSMAAATSAALGVVQLATTAEAQARTNTAKAIVPSTLNDGLAVFTNARAPRQGLVFDGTAGATLINVASLGPSFTVHIIARPDTLSVNLGVLKASGTVAGNVYFTANAPQIYNGTTYRGPGAATATVGKTDVWDYTVTGGVGTWYKNGLSVWTGADAGTYPDAIVGVGFDANNYRFQGYLAVAIYNRALAAGEVLALYEGGAASANDFNSATNTSVNVDAFTNGTGAATFTGATAAGFAVSGTTGGSAGTAGRSVYGTDLGVLRIGTKYRASFTATINSGEAPTVAIAHVGNGYASNQVTVTAGANVIEFTLDTARASNRLVFASSSTTAIDYVISGLSLLRVGVVLSPNQHASGAGMVWIDQSGTGAHLVLPTSGIAWALPGPGPFKVRGTTSTNGNQQLFGATCLPANCQLTRVRARARTNTPTITIGTASGGAQIVASVALSTTWKDLTIALTGGIVSSASSIWIGSNSTDVVEIDVTAEPLSF